VKTLMDAESNNVNGSWWRSWVRRSYAIPVAGYCIRMVTAMLNLPHILRNIHAHQTFAAERFAEWADRKAAEDPHRFDDMFLRFEDRFRGSMEEIGRKLNVYLPMIHEVARRNKAGFSLLDVGCGRGEWLELLRKEGVPAKGIDLNRMAVQYCRQQDLDASEADVVEYIRKLDRGSVNVITGFHLIEHLPLQTLLLFVDEAFAVLRSGGMIILETPNPTNILVSAYDFYRDPSHLRPIHPDTINFIAEDRGFVRTGSYFVFDNGSERMLMKSTDWKLDDMNDYLQAPRDFVLIGYKP
jgi:2-polyprenyl-3-methyl-5-hydroxy-6-metoxy-1,4-benzoquinol methylase